MDFKEIKERVPIMDVIRLLDIEMKPSGMQFRSPCPCGKGDDRALCVTPDKKVFYCHGSKVGGDCTALYGHVKGIEKMGDAAEALKKALGLESGKKEKPAFNRQAYLEKLTTDHPLLQACGIDPEEAKAWGIGVSTSGVHAGKIVFPVFKDGEFDRYLSAEEVFTPRRVT
jgi:hypothetical protein